MTPKNSSAKLISNLEDGSSNSQTFNTPFKGPNRLELDQIDLNDPQQADLNSQNTEGGRENTRYNMLGSPTSMLFEAESTKRGFLNSNRGFQEIQDIEENNNKEHHS